jgi:biotin carboxylase
MEMNVLVEIPEEDKMFTVAVERQAKIGDLCLELAQSLGLTSASHVTLIYEG